MYDIHFTDDLIIPDFLSSKSVEPDPGGESFEDLFERFASMRGMWLLVCVCVYHLLLFLHNQHMQRLCHMKKEKSMLKRYVYYDTFCKHTMGLNTLQCSTCMAEDSLY